MAQGIRKFKTCAIFFVGGGGGGGVGGKREEGLYSLFIHLFSVQKRYVHLLQLTYLDSLCLHACVAPESCP